MSKKEKVIHQENPAEENVTVPQAEETCSDNAAEKNEAVLLKEQLEQANDRLLRTLAEYDNYRKRSQREKDSIYPDAVADTIAKFLPVVDNFERALAIETTDPEYKKGVGMILTSFMDQLKALGVESFGGAGEPFDPLFHNAVMHVDEETTAENTIVEVFQKGYRQGDRVIRHAMVKVAN